MTLGLREPKLPGALISVDNAPVVAPLGGDFSRYIQGMRNIENSKITKREEADKIMQPYEKVRDHNALLGALCKQLISSLVQSLPIRQFLLANLSRPPNSEHLHFRVPIDILESGLPLLGAFPFKDTDKVSFAGPSLFVRGTRSHYVPDRALPLVRRFFPNSELRDIESGHWVISEQPDLFIKGKDVVVIFVLRSIVLT